MFQRRPRKFRRRSNGRGGMHHGNGNAQNRMRSSSFTNIQIKNNFRTPLSAEKLFEKYTSLAKEAMSSGDKTLSENYLQHADHFMRIIEDKNKNQNKPANDLAKPNEAEKDLFDNSRINQKNDTKDKI